MMCTCACTHDQYLPPFPIDPQPMLTRKNNLPCKAPLPFKRLRHPCILQSPTGAHGLLMDCSLVVVVLLLLFLLWWLWLSWVVMVSGGGDGGGGGLSLTWLWWVVVVVVVGDGEEGLRVVGWGCGGLFSRDVGIICFLNNYIPK